MADNLIFPIGFDLEKGVRDVMAKGDSYLRQIEHAMNRKPIVLRAEVDASKFQTFSRQFTNSIDGISAKLAQAQRLWNAMSFDVKFNADGNLSRRAQVVFDAFQQLTQASATMGQRLGEVNRNLAKSEQDTARAITAEYDKRQKQINDQIRLKERQAAAEERVRQGQLKGVNVGYVDTQKQVEAVRNLRLQYEAILPMLNAMAQRRVQIKVSIDKQFEADIQRINGEIARLRQSNLRLGAKGDTNAIQANLQAIRQLESELQRISQQKIDLLNTNKINSDLARLRSEVSSVFAELQAASRKLSADNSINTALDRQSAKVLELHDKIKQLDVAIAQMNAQGKMYNSNGGFTNEATAVLQQRISLTKQLEQESITGRQAQIKLEQQLREEKRQTQQAAEKAAREAERQAKAEAAARKQAQDAANAENKARQDAYNARRRQGQETQRILNKEAKSIADITAKLQIQQQRLQTANVGSAKFNKIAEEVKRLTADLEKANQKMRELTGQTQSGAARQVAAHKQVTQELSKQSTYLSRLAQRMAAYWSIQQVGSFLTNVREVTAQFELQRVSLGAILQSQEKSNQLFSEIKAFALKSPVSILDLTKYTKQLAAYKIGYEELFETTKKLTDVSVGLGVAMDRVVLAYGQVRATGYLRASEVRQFTEMGVPIVEELAKKLEKLNDKAVTAADVMELISKRGISFEMVKEVFDDMTSAGGIFYNMQEKQGNTLYGMWAKLGDAASVMYEQIGNTEFVNSQMKSAISILTSLMKNWRLAGGELMVLATTIGIVCLKQKAHTAAMIRQRAAVGKVRAAGMAYNAILKEERALTASATAAQRASAAARKANAKAALDAAIAERTAAEASNVWTRSMNKLKAVFMGNWVTLLIAAIASIGVAIYNAVEKANRLKNTLNNIEAERLTLTSQSVRNFEYLANTAVKAANGSKKQKDALDELKRTYSEIIPEQDLTIKKLKEQNGNYQALTTTIEEYIAVQQKQKKISAIEEEYSPIIQENYKALREYLSSGVSGFHDRELKLSDEEIERFFKELEKRADDTTTTLNKKIRDSLKAIGVEADALMAQHIENASSFGGIFSGESYLENYINAFNRQADAITAVQQASEGAVGNLGKYKTLLDSISARASNLNMYYSGGTLIGKGTYLYQLSQNNYQIKKWGESVKSELENAGVAIEEGLFKLQQIDERDITQISTIDFNKLIPMLDTTEVKQKLGDNYETFKNYVLTIKDLYEGLIPSDPIVQDVRNKLVAISNSMGVNMDVMQKYMWDGKTSVKDHLEALKNASDILEEELYKYRNYIKQYGLLAKTVLALKGIDVDALTKEFDALQAQIKHVEGYVKPDDKKSKGSKSDNRLSKLQEIESTLTKINQKYDELVKKEGQTKALEDVNKLYGDTLKYVNKLGKQFKLNFAMPTEFKTLQDYRKAIQGVIEKLKMKGYEKAALDLEETIGTGDIDALQKQIEEQLKELADRISRTKTAKEFYEKILGMTGDYSLASKVAESIFGQNGSALQKALADQVRGMTNGIELPEGIISADNIINYKALREFAEANKTELGKMYDELIKISNDGQKDLAKTYEGYLKDLEKAKSYSDKRIELARYTANQIAEINASALPQDEKERLAAGYREREDKKSAELEWEAFKDMPMYVQMFADLDNASTTMLRNMQGMLDKLKGKWGESLQPQELKEMQSRLNEIGEQLAKRNPFKAIGDGISKIRTLNKEYGSLKNVEVELTRATEKLIGDKAELAAALAAETALRAEYNKIAGEQGAESDAAKAKQSELAAATALVENLREVLDLSEEQAKIWQDIIDKYKKGNDEIDDGFQGISSYVQKCREAQDAVKGAVEEWTALGDDELWNTIFDGLDYMATSAAQGGEAVAAYFSGDYFTMVTKGISSVANLAAGIGKLFWGSKVAKANKEIKKQQKLLEQLEYTYGRLEKAADKAFGAEYLRNYGEQLESLQAQQSAYLKQAEAERSKGKKADKEKIKDYENQARETADKIKELQDDLVAHFTGSSKTDVARQMAKSWVDARASMSDTFAAIKGDYQDLIKNMIVEGAAARVIENALTPMWDKMDKMLQGNNVEGAIDALVGGMDSALNAANNGMEVLWKALEARGYDMKKLISDTDSEYSGIAKSVAGATSEEINNVAAIGNTLLYYVSPIPRIDASLAKVVAMMESGSSAVSSPSTGGWTDWQQQAMDNYIAIQRNTADTVVECRRAANACEETVNKLNRIIVSKGGQFGVNTFLR